jgi:hypothetical protein
MSRCGTRGWSPTLARIHDRRQQTRAALAGMDVTQSVSRHGRHLDMPEIEKADE